MAFGQTFAGAFSNLGCYPRLVSARKLPGRSVEREFGRQYMLEDRGILAIFTEFAFDFGVESGF